MLKRTLPPVTCWPDITGHDRLSCLVTTAELLAYEAKPGNSVSFSPSLPSGENTSQHKPGVGRVRDAAVSYGPSNIVIFPY